MLRLIIIDLRKEFSLSKFTKFSSPKLISEMYRIFHKICSDPKKKYFQGMFLDQSKKVGNKA